MIAAESTRLPAPNALPLLLSIPVALLWGVMCLAGNASAALDKWGGDSRVRHPESAYQVGLNTAVAAWTITDAAKSWSTDALRGKILQPDTGKEIYFLIKGNSATQVQVHGSSIDANEDRCYLTLDKVAAVGAQYAVLDQWRVDKIRQRWSLFDPYGNMFFIKSLNGFDYESVRNGSDVMGKTYVANMIAKNGGANEHEAIVPELDTVKSVGFNTLGEVANVWKCVPGARSAAAALTTARYLPFIGAVRVNSLPLANVGVFTVAGANCFDAVEDDFQAEVETQLRTGTGAKADGIVAFSGRTYWNAAFVTPYRDAKYSIAANPWYIGLDWDEEPAYLRSENTNEHLGYRILTSPATSARKGRSISYLQSLYASIEALNAAWGTRFADWTALAQDTGAAGINAALSAEPYCRAYGTYRETNTAMKADLDKIAADFWRIYTSKVRAALDNLIAVHKVNFGPGYHGWIGDSSANWDGILSPVYLFRGSVSEDGTTPFLDIIGIGDPMHGPLSDPGDPFAYVRSDLVSIYGEVGRPYWHESVWITAEADSAVAHAGTITALTPTTLRDGRADFDTALNWPGAYQGVGSRIWLLLNGDQPRESWMFHSISATGALGDQLTVDKEVGPGNAWMWDSTPDMTAVSGAGNQYRIVVSDVIPHFKGGLRASFYLPLTQEERALVYTSFIDGVVNLRADNGDYIDLGFSQWQFFDYAWRNGYYEHRNFGFASIKGNLYDGTAGIAKGEVQDTGNFVGSVSARLKGVYDVLAGSATAPASIAAPRGLRVVQ